MMMYKHFQSVFPKGKIADYLNKSPIFNNSIYEIITLQIIYNNDKN